MTGCGSTDEPASSGREIVWNGTEAGLNTYGGGDAGAVGDASGPLWQINHDFNGRMIVGVGDIPGTDPAISIALDATSDSNSKEGSYDVALIAENCQHFHGCGTDGGIDDPPNMLSRTWSSIKNFVRRINDLNTSGSTGWHDNTTALQNGTMGTTEPYQDPNFPDSTPHFNMPPYLGRYIALRTARIWVTSPN